MAIFGLLSGCLPIPHTRVEAPSISGVVMRSGKPVERAVVILTAYPSSKYSKSVRTESTQNGQFKIGPISDVEKIMAFIGDPSTHWRLELEIHDDRFVGFEQHRFGYSSRDETMNLVCDTESPRLEFMARGRLVSAICRSTKESENPEPVPPSFWQTRWSADTEGLRI